MTKYKSHDINKECIKDYIIIIIIIIIIIAITMVLKFIMKYYLRLPMKNTRLSSFCKIKFTNQSKLKKKNYFKFKISTSCRYVF